MKITKARLKKLGACDEAIIKYFSDKKSWEAKDLLNAAIKNEDWSMSRWGIAHLMTYKQLIMWAIYRAEQAIKIYESEYLDDNRPRGAIIAAKKYLKKPSEENKAAAYAAADAAHAAADAADAAHAAADAAHAAADAAHAAADAAHAPYATGTEGFKIMQIKLLKKGLLILESV